MAKYILFCAQEANFQTRAMIIPYEEMQTPKRQAELEILRANATSKTIKHKGEKYDIDNLIFRKIQWEDNVGRTDNSNPELTRIIGDYSHCAEGWPEECCNDFEGIVTDIAPGFNHLSNYCELRKMTVFNGQPVEIVEGFLVLEKNDNKLNLSQCDTVEEMFQKYYLGGNQENK